MMKKDEVKKKIEEKRNENWGEDGTRHGMKDWGEDRLKEETKNWRANEIKARMKYKGKG